MDSVLCQCQKSKMLPVGRGHSVKGDNENVLGELHPVFVAELLLSCRLLPRQSISPRLLGLICEHMNICEDEVRHGVWPIPQEIQCACGRRQSLSSRPCASACSLRPEHFLDNACDHAWVNTKRAPEVVHTLKQRVCDVANSRRMSECCTVAQRVEICPDAAEGQLPLSSAELHPPLNQIPCCCSAEYTAVQCAHSLGLALDEAEKPGVSGQFRQWQEEGSTEHRSRVFLSASTVISATRFELRDATSTCTFKSHQSQMPMCSLHLGAPRRQGVKLLPQCDAGRIQGIVAGQCGLLLLESKRGLLKTFDVSCQHLTGQYCASEKLVLHAGQHSCQAARGALHSKDLAQLPVEVCIILGKQVTSEM